MLQTVRINKVSIIPTRKDENGNVVPFNRVLVRIEKHEPIFRSFEQFLSDLKDSHLIDEYIDSIYDSEVRDILSAIEGGTVTGDLQFVKKGDKYTLTEMSGAITNPSHPLYGKKSVGDVMESTMDATRVVDGFLTLKRDAIAQVSYDSASIYAKGRLKAEGFMQRLLKSVEATNGNAVVTEADFELDEDIAAEVTGEAAVPAAKK